MTALSLLLDASNLICQFYIRHQGCEEKTERDLTRFIHYLSDRYGADHVLAALDHKDNFRRELHPAYKRGRSKKPQGLSQLLDRAAPLMLRSGAMPVIAPGYEADDVLATLAAHAPGRAVIVTSDTDLNAVVTRTVTLRRPITATTVRERDVIEQYQLHPREIALYKALIGDKSDNFYGVKDLTKDEARHLASQYSGVTDLLGHLEDLPDSTARKFRRTRPAHLLRNEQLVRLVDTTPVQACTV